MRAKASVKLTVPNGPRVNVGGGGSENHAKLKNLEFEESGHTGFQKELTPAEREAIASVAGKEDKSNKIQSIDALMNDEQYLSAGGTLALVNTAEDNAKSHADGLYSGLNQRVTTNEQSIAGAFTYCGELDTIISQVVNDVTSNKEVIDGNVDRIIAVENETAELKRDIEACGDFELIDSTTLTEDVAQIVPTINGQYKELFWFFEIPAQADASTNTEKARFYLYPKANAKMADLKLFQQTDWYTTNYTAAWNLCFSIKVIGKYARSNLWFWTNAYRLQVYGSAPNLNAQNGVTVPNQVITTDYINALTLAMNSKGGTRVFPVGTKYELWGVKA